MQTLSIVTNRIACYSVRKALLGICAGIFAAKNTSSPCEKHS